MSFKLLKILYYKWPAIPVDWIPRSPSSTTPQTCAAGCCGASEGNQSIAQVTSRGFLKPTEVAHSLTASKWSPRAEREQTPEGPLKMFQVVLWTPVEPVCGLCGALKAASESQGPEKLLYFNTCRFWYPETGSRNKTHVDKLSQLYFISKVTI